MFSCVPAFSFASHCDPESDSAQVQAAEQTDWERRGRQKWTDVEKKASKLDECCGVQIDGSGQRPFPSTAFPRHCFEVDGDDERGERDDRAGFERGQQGVAAL